MAFTIDVCYNPCGEPGGGCRDKALVFPCMLCNVSFGPVPNIAYFKTRIMDGSLSWDDCLQIHARSPCQTLLSIIRVNVVLIVIVKGLEIKSHAHQCDEWLPNRCCASMHHKAGKKFSHII